MKIDLSLLNPPPPPDSPWWEWVKRPDLLLWRVNNLREGLDNEDSIDPNDCQAAVELIHFLIQMMDESTAKHSELSDAVTAFLDANVEHSCAVSSNMDVGGMTDAQVEEAKTKEDRSIGMLRITLGKTPKAAFVDLRKRLLKRAVEICYERSAEFAEFAKNGDDKQIHGNLCAEQASSGDGHRIRRLAEEGG